LSAVSPFDRLGDIAVQGLSYPFDIVVCRDTSQLYIADGGSQHAIWRVNLLRNKQVDKFITIQEEPLSLSVNSRRLLITPRDGDALFLYSDDGNKLNRIQLPDYMHATRAVETTHNTYIVSHVDVNRSTGDTESERNSVSEVNVDGRVVCTFRSQHIDIGFIQFNRPWYLTLDDNNHVIVADIRDKRVVVLKSDLQLKRVLIPSLDGPPSRLCLSKSTGLLFIIYMYSSVIDIYKVLS
jgi:DNA-binding beta-propeller fold protein YncE